jgi:hypothetical protein
MSNREQKLYVDVHRAKSLREELRSLEASIARRQERRQITEADERAMTQMQVRADAVYTELGRRAPPPIGFEYPDEYRIRLLEGIQRHSKTWAKATLDSMSGNVLDLAESQIFEEARTDAACPCDLKPGEIRAIDRRKTTGHGETRFVGNDTHFVQRFTRPPARVLFRSAEEYQAMTRDALMANSNALMSRQQELVRRGAIKISTPPTSSSGNPIIEVSRVVAKKLGGA